MDPRLTRLYQDELIHLHELGREFAREHPKIAARLGLDKAVVSDPYVERLLEGFAFLTARVRLKLEAEYPQLIAQLLESLYPNFIAPLPSMLITRFGVDPNDPNLARGFRVPRGSLLESTVPLGQDTRCEYSTAMDVVLWPVQVTAVRYFSHAPDLGLSRDPATRTARGGLRLTLKAGGGLGFDQLGMDRLRLHFSAPDDVAFRLHELALGHPLGTLVVAGGQTAFSDADSVQPVGFAADEALLPEGMRAFSGHRLLQEVAALPQRLLFVEVTDLARRLAATRTGEIELVLLFGRGDPSLESLVDESSVALFCTPAVNLFRKRLGRVLLGTGEWEHHLVPDRARPQDFEVHSVEAVTGHGTEGTREFRPLYSSDHGVDPASQGGYTLRREPRRPSERQNLKGARVPSYLGEEVFISVVDTAGGAGNDDLRQLAVDAWCTNRDLPVLLQGTAATDWTLEAPGPVQSVTVLRGPTRPASRAPTGPVGWALVRLLTHNHLLVSDDAEAAAAMLRDTLRLFGLTLDAAWAHQLDGLRSLQVSNVVRRLPFSGPLAFGSGLDVRLEVDEQAFQGSSAFLLGSVLEVFLARHAALNSFTQFTLASAQRGVIKTWPARIGRRQAL